ncbi:hypothetical protein PQD71_gp020 [Kosakonia phage Kc263]|uniref:Uncharacterized protein n=1 Tax=Kosakonia phage Kc263 TaxID=2863194 RepID=A0AAE8BFF4_9CAUD|nr:hypothetical protein PQD71_gp020 [Kosakonia phage Kc263]QYN79913.1 hypothetical protein [Kosakonia phage Kc263]
MAELIKVNKKVINDPLYTPVVKFLKERIAFLEANGPQSELELARERYTGIVAGDLVIENPVAFSDGAIRVCFVSRKTGFARVDVDITRVQMKEILDDFQVPLVVINDPDHMKAWVKANPTESALLWLEDRQTYGVLLSQEAARTHAGAMTAFGELFFEEYTLTRDSLTAIDYETLESGTVKVSDVSFGEATYPLFIYELVLEEANLPEITSNLPATLTTRRGETFSIPNTFWFAGTQDITLEIDLVLSTDSGYTIPARSSDLLSLNGEAIFGSATEDMQDRITIRATYMWNGRPVRKTFRIAVTIEKDEVSDLTLVPVPETIQATTGDTLQVTISAFFTETPVTILVPPSEIVSSRNYGKLNYVSTNPDGGMVYSGTITGALPGNKESDTDLFSGKFLYNGDDGTPYWATGYVNIVIVKPEVQPKFEVKKFTSAVAGYKGATGTIDVQVFYGENQIPLSQLAVTTGVKGSKGLIEYKALQTDKIEYELIADSGTPGVPTSDAFTQFLIYVDDKGIRHAAQPVFNVTVKKASEVKIVPVAPQPRNVKRYQYGTATFQVLVNGIDKTNTITNLRNKNASDEYVTFPVDFPNQWQILNTKAESYTHAMTFQFDLVIDGEAPKTYEFNQEFVIEPWTRTSGPNSGIVIVPEVASISGNSDEPGSFAFKVFEGAKDITADAKIVTDRTVVPNKVTFNSINYDTTRHMFVVSYFKDNGVVSSGKIFAAKKSDANPTDDTVGLVDIDVNVNQIKILKVVGKIAGTAITVEETADVELNLEFAGTRLSLDDANLTFTKAFVSQTSIQTRNKDTLTLASPDWKFVGRTFNEGMIYKVTYKDPADGQVYTIQQIGFPIVITYPPMRLEQTTDTIDGKIWDKGTFPLKLMAGNHDFTGSVYSVELITANKYVAIAGFNWNIYFAESDATSTIVGLRMRWGVGETVNQTLSTDFRFNVAAWDGITFATTEVTPANGISVDSGDTGEITVKMVYKGNDATQTATFDQAGSTIPRTFILGTPYYDPDRGFVIPYTTTKGGDYDLKLKFKAPTPGTETLTATIATSVTWPYDLNIDTNGASIRGFWEDVLDYPLVLNFAGTPVALDDPSLNLTFTSGTGEPITLEAIKQQALSVALNEGGTLGTNYNYTVDIGLEYQNQADGQLYNKALSIPATIRVSAVKVGANPSQTVKVYSRGAIPTTLVDERGRIVPITSYAPRGTNNYIAFVSPKNWYITNGSLADQITTALPLTLGYDMGGASYTLDVDVNFTILKFDGIKLKVETVTTELKGKAGDIGTLQFDFTYLGDPITGMTLDTANSIIPRNLAVGDLTADGELPYTLLGQAVDTVKLVFLRPNGAVPPVNNVDSVTLSMGVTSTSSNEPFSLTTYDTAISLDWGKSDILKVTPRYGLYDLPANTPGLTYTLTEEASKSVAIIGTRANGIILRATRSNVPGSVDVRPEHILVSYNVGAPDPKTAEMSFSATISMGNPDIGNNATVQRAIWALGTFTQQVKFNDVVLNTIDHFEVLNVNKYVEMVSDKGYEIIGTELTTSTQSIPMRAYYKVDETDTLQYIDFTATFLITGSSSVRFKVTPTPSKIEGVIEGDIVIAFRPLYKDKLVGGAATFKQELSTLPPQVVIKSHTVSGNDHLITFTGKVGGIGDAEMVFWSPVAGDNPPAREVWKGKIEARILDGELGLEVGNRDNLLTGKSGDTGVYKLELLFGALPISMSDEITRGNLTIAVETGAPTSLNANVLKATAWHDDTFDFSLKGPVSPGKTVSVSDYINVTYKFGGKTYNRRVEIPMSYTSLAATVGAVNYGTVSMWKTGALNFPGITCDGVTMPTPQSASDVTDPAQGYVKITAKNYEIINADPVQVSKGLLLKYVGIYRNWTYEAEGNASWTISAWNGYTFEPSFITSWTGYLGYPTTQYLTVKLKGQVFTPTQGYDYLDRTLTDLKGLFTLEFTGNTAFSGGSYAVYKLTPLKVSKDTVRLAFRVYNSPVPGVEKVDYTYVDLNFECKAKTLSTTSVTTTIGGNGDAITVPLALAITGSTGTQNVSVATNSPDLTITLPNEDVFKIVSRTTNGLGIEITAPLSKRSGSDVVNMTLTYKDPLGVDVTSVIPYTVNYRLPQDYPAVDLLPPFYVGNWKSAPLWSHGAFTNWFKVRGGQAANSADVTAQSDIINVTGPWVIPSRDLPEVGDRWWVIDGAEMSALIPHVYTFKAPFRGGFVNDVTVTVTLESASRNGADTPFVVGAPVASQRWPGNANTEIEVPFNIKWRGYKYGEAIFRADLSTTASAGAFSSAFEVVGQRYDNVTGFTYLTLKVLKDVTSNVTFVFDHKDAGSTPVAGKTEASAVYVFSPVNVVPVTPAPTTTMWKYIRLNQLFKIMDGTTDVTAQATLLSIDNPLAVIYQATNASSPAFSFQDHNANPGGTIPLTFTIQLGVANQSRVITYTINVNLAAFDGKEFVAGAPNPTQVYLALGASTDVTVSALDFRSNISALATDKSIVTAAKFDAANPNLQYVRWGFTSSPLALLVTYKSLNLFRGKVKTPIDYIGAGSTDYPVGTLDKNFLYLEQDIVVYEEKLYPYPAGYVVPPLTGEFGKQIVVPIQFTMGNDIVENLLATNVAGLTWTVPLDNGIVAKPGSGFVSSATGIMLNVTYDNRGADLTMTVPVTFTYNAGYRGRAVNTSVTVDVPITIKGTNTGDVTTVINATNPSVIAWQTGNLPFYIQHNGVTVATASYKSVDIKANPYVRKPETNPGNFTRAWEVYFGETTQTVAPVEFTVVFNDGVKDVTVTYTSTFTIAAYDGKEFVMTLRSPSTFNNGIVGTPNSSPIFQIWGKYRNTQLTTDDLTNKYSVWDKGFDLPGFLRITNRAAGQTVGGGGAGQYLNVTCLAGPTDMPVNVRGEVLFGKKDKENDPNAIENVDFVRVPINSYVYISNKFYPINWTKEINGVFGTGQTPTYPLNISFRQGITAVNNASISTYGIDATDFMNIVVTGTSSSTAYALAFKTELTSAKQKTQTVNFWAQPTGSDPATRAYFPVEVTQNSNYQFPTVTDLHQVSTNLNESGTLPFKLVDPDSGADVTSGASITAVAANSYIDVVNGKWHVNNARTGDTTVTVTLTYSVLYRGNTLLINQDVEFLIKGFTGAPTISNVTEVTGNVWEKGTQLPFTININGAPVPAAWITANSGVSPNSRVTVGPAVGAWKIIAGDLTQALRETVTYTVTVTVGSLSWTVTQAVVFNINKYDGIEFKAVLLNAGNGNGDFIFSPRIQNGGQPSSYFAGYYRGEREQNVFNAGIINRGPFNNYVDGINQPPNVVYIMSPSYPDIGRYNFTVAIGRADGVGEGKNRATITVPAIITSGGYVPVYGGGNFEGKLGDVFDVGCAIAYGNVWADLTNPVHAITFSPANVVEMVPGSLTAKGFKVRFKADVDVKKVTTITASATRPSPAYVGSVTLSMTQNPTREPVSGSATAPVMKVGETGKIHITGSYGSQGLAGNVTFVSAESDAKGLYTFNSMSTNPDGSLDVNVTALAVGKDNVTIRLKVNGATGTVEGKDILTLTVPAEVIPAQMNTPDDFDSEIEGVSGDTVTVTQYMTLPN